jgi:hypothetical protein
MKTVSSGYADVNGIKLYHEIYGEGEPLVLIHGGLTTIGEMLGWVQPLAKTRRVIAMEMQGHGRTADTDRPMSFTMLGDDIAVLLDHLKIPKARPRRHRRRSSRPGSEAGEDRSALAPSGRVRVLAGAPHPACLDLEKESRWRGSRGSCLEGRQLFPKASSSKP